MFREWTAEEVELKRASRKATERLPDIVGVEYGDYGSVFDADGCMVDKCIEANLATGACVFFVTDSDGSIKVNEAGDGIMQQVEMRPAPLRFIPRKEATSNVITIGTASPEAVATYVIPRKG